MTRVRFRGEKKNCYIVYSFNNNICSFMQTTIARTTRRLHYLVIAPDCWVTTIIYVYSNDFYLPFRGTRVNNLRLFALKPAAHTNILLFLLYSKLDTSLTGGTRTTLSIPILLSGFLYRNYI